MGFSVVTARIIITGSKDRLARNWRTGFIVAVACKCVLGFAFHLVFNEVVLVSKLKKL
jgi:Na+-driven multidrug efflux pump